MSVPPPSSSPAAAEEIVFDATALAAYEAASRVLQDTTAAAAEEGEALLAPLPSVVSLRTDIPEEPDSSADESYEAQPVTLVTPTRGHHELYRALEHLEGLEKEELTLLSKAALARQLTEIVTDCTYADARHAAAELEVLGATVPRRVCQHPFRKNDIVWVCRTCQADETCVLCHACFSQSNHEGHDVAFYHAQAGGCCDCGDPDGTYF
jgi:hypothetical protein